MNDNLPPGMTQEDIDRRYGDVELPLDLDEDYDPVDYDDDSAEENALFDN